MLSWEIYEFFRSSPQMCTKTAALKNFTIITGKLQNYNCITLTQVLSSEYCQIFKNTYFEEHLTAASDFLKQLQNNGEQQFLLHWLFHQVQISYWQFNWNLSICVSLAKDWFMLHKKFNQDLATYDFISKKLIHVK